MSEDALVTHLQRCDRLEEPAFVFGESVDIDAVISKIEQAYARPVITLRAIGLIPPSDADVRQTVSNSLQARGVLAVVLDDKAGAPVLKVVEQLARDGYLPEIKEKGWEPVKPPSDWRMVVVAKVKDPSTLPGDLASRFGASIAL